MGTGDAITRKGRGDRQGRCGGAGAACCPRAASRRGDERRRTAARDRIRGWRGDDVLKGKAGNDCLSGGPGHDRLRCGPGARDEARAGHADKLRGCEVVRRRTTL